MDNMCVHTTCVDPNENLSKIISISILVFRYKFPYIVYNIHILYSSIDLLILKLNNHLAKKLKEREFS